MCSSDLRGIDERQVKPDRIRKSVGAEDTFVEDIDDLDHATAELKPLVEKVWRHCEAQGTSGKTVTVKIKYSDFTQATRSRTGAFPVAGAAEIMDAAASLLVTVYPFRRSVRLLGVILSLSPMTRVPMMRNNHSSTSIYEQVNI